MSCCNYDPAELKRLLEEQARRRAEILPSDFAKSQLGFYPDPWQERFLNSKAKRIILNCSRQSGKSTTTAALALHEAINIPKSVIVLDSPSLRQSQELMIKFRDFLDMIPDVRTLESDTKLTVKFPNGSRVLALPGSEKTIRGISAVTLFVGDEASRIPDPLYNSIKPMLAVSNGRLILMSTPFGKRGFFHEIWTNGQGWEKVEVPAEECPRISREFLEEEKRENPWFDQEYHCRFMETEDQLFNYDNIIDSFTSEVKPLEF